MAIGMPVPVSASDLARLALSGPRYTSYPPATELGPAVGPADAHAELARLGMARTPVSLYAHLPFCRNLCWYCGCNVVATRDRSRGTAYVDTLLSEVAMVAASLGIGHRVRELALGGGSPNFLLADDLRRLVAGVRRWLSIDVDARLSVELDPRDTTTEQLDVLAAAGFRAVSVGIQDFAEGVQSAIHRFQSAEQTGSLICAARARGFDDVNADMVYGLPRQTPATFAATLDTVIDLAPDRIALFGYAHLPGLRPHQYLVERAGRLPDLEERAELLVLATERLGAAGYLPIGLDHFARPGSPLARAAAAGALDRTFQGYVVHTADAIIGVGATAISTTDGLFWQNQGDLPAWTQALRDGHLPVARGIALDDDDRLRRTVITRLMCDGAIDLAAVPGRLGGDLGHHFAAELEALRDWPELCTVDGTRIAATPLGKVLIRNLCMPFDRYLPERRRTSAFSTTV